MMTLKTPYLCSLLLTVALVSCSEPTRVPPPDSSPDLGVQADADGPEGQDETSEAGQDGCGMAVGPSSDLLTPRLPIPPLGPGLDSAEAGAYALFSDAVANSEGVLMTATYDHDAGNYRLERWIAGVHHVMTFRRGVADGALSFDVMSGSAADFFASTNGLRYPDRASLFVGYEDPQQASWPDLGYATEDPRVGFLNAETTAYPRAMERIASLFDAPQGPDVMVEFLPFSKGGPGTHGGLGLLQSRATLILSGAGVRTGVTLAVEATLADVAPTVLAALGASTIGGVSQAGDWSDGLYLTWQDGRALVEALETAECETAQRAVIMTFDGLMATELNHQLLSESPDVDLPHLRALAHEGVVFEGGATSPWPSFSAAGHMSIGTGVWSGHHGIINNIFHDRASGESINFFAFIADPKLLLSDSGAFLATYEAFVPPAVESLAQAVHRNFGAYVPAETGLGEGAFVAVLNDFAVLGADRTSFDLLSSSTLTSRAKLALAELADDFALNQALDLLDDPTLPVPKLLMLSFYSTDKAGEGAGPHSDLLLNTLKEVDKRVGELRTAYAARAGDAGTLWVMVSDHGMELQDPARATNFATRLAESGLKVHQPMQGMIYFKTLTLTVTLDGLVATARVSDHDNDSALQGVEVRCLTCTPTLASSDAAGEATFSVPAGTVLEFEATHSEFNPQTYTVATALTE